MTNQILESAGVVSQQGVPTPAGGVTPGQPPSTAPVTFTAEQWAQVQTEVDRKVQSQKDRRIAELENSFAELRQSLSSAPAQQPPQAQAPSLANGGNHAAQPAVVDFLKIFQTVGVDPNDATVLQLTGQYGNNPDALELALIRHQRAKANPPPASAAALTAPSGSMGVGSDDQQAKTIMGELSNLRAQRIPDRKRIGELTAELRRLTS